MIAEYQTATTVPMFSSTFVSNPAGPTLLKLIARNEPFGPKSRHPPSEELSSAQSGFRGVQAIWWMPPSVSVARYRSPTREGIFATEPSAANVQSFVCAQSSQNDGAPTADG